MSRYPLKTKLSELLIVIALILFGMLGAYLTPGSRAATYNPPGSIATDCSVDVTAALLSWIASLPNNSTLQFGAGACYRIDGVLEIINRSGLIFEGNGATFKAVTDGTELPPRDARTRSQFRLRTSSDITMRNMIIRGANPNAGVGFEAYVEALEAQHSFDIISSSNILIHDTQVYDIYGDFVYIGSQSGPWSSNITIRNNRFERNGRQGLGVTGAQDVIFENNYIAQIRRATLDVEPNTASGGAKRVKLKNNTIGPGRLLLLASKGACGPTEDIEISGNTLQGRRLNGVIEPPIGCRRGRFSIINNTSDLGEGNPQGASMAFKRIDGLEVRGNTTPVQANRNMSLFSIQESTAIRARDNTVINGVSTMKVLSGNTDYESCNNRLSSGGVFTEPIVCPIAPSSPSTPSTPSSPASSSPSSSGDSTSTSDNGNSASSQASPSDGTVPDSAQKPSNPLEALQASGSIIGDSSQPLVRRIINFSFLWLLMVGFALGIWWMYKHKIWEYLMPRHHMAATGGGMTPGMIVGDFTGDKYNSGFLQRLRDTFKR